MLKKILLLAAATTTTSMMSYQEPIIEVNKNIIKNLQTDLTRYTDTTTGLNATHFTRNNTYEVYDPTRPAGQRIFSGSEAEAIYRAMQKNYFNQ